MTVAGFSERQQRRIERLEPPVGAVKLILGLSGSFGLRTLDADEDERVEYDAFVVGIGSSTRRVDYFATQECIEVSLPPCIAVHVLREDARHLVGTVAALEDVAGRRARRLLGSIRGAASWRSRFECLQRFIASALAPAAGTAGPITSAWNMQANSGGQRRIAELAAGIGWSERYLERRFAEECGVTPKFAARLLRFDVARNLVAASPHVSLADVAARAGYSDQSHLSREFRRFSGLSPAAFRAANADDRQPPPR